MPESFKVLIKELQSLCLDIQVLDQDGNQIELKDDEDAMDTFNLARMDADNERDRYVADDAELEASGVAVAAAAEAARDAGYSDMGDDDLLDI